MSSVSIIESDINYCRWLDKKINAADGLKCLGYYTSSDVAIKNIPKDDPDVVLINVEFPGGTPGTCAVRTLSDKMPELNILMLSDNQDDEVIYHAMTSGASGYILKCSSAEEIISAIHEVLNNGMPMSKGIGRKFLNQLRYRPHKKILTPRELEILELMDEGLSNEQIARRLGLSLNTIKTHIKDIFRKLHAHSRVEALRNAKRQLQIL